MRYSPDPYNLSEHPCDTCERRSICASGNACKTYRVYLRNGKVKDYPRIITRADFLLPELKVGG